MPLTLLLLSLVFTLHVYVLGLFSFVYVRVMRQRECQTDAHAGQDGARGTPRYVDG